MRNNLGLTLGLLSIVIVIGLGIWGETYAFSKCGWSAFAYHNAWWAAVSGACDK